MTDSDRLLTESERLRVNVAAARETASVMEPRDCATLRTYVATRVTASLMDESESATVRGMVSTRETAMKVRNLRRTPRAWLCVLPDDFFGRWIQVGGPVHIVQLPEAMEGLVDYYRRISGEHPNWDEYRASMQQERRILLQIELTSAGPDQAG